MIVTSAQLAIICTIIGYVAGLLAGRIIWSGDCIKRRQEND